MRTFCLKGCRIKHVKCGILFTLGIIAIVGFTVPFIVPGAVDSPKVLQSISVGIGILLGKCSRPAILRCLARLCPFSCGHRKHKFTGTCKKPLQTILLSIDDDFPSTEEIQQLKNDALTFLIDVKEELEKRITTFECIFAGSIEESYGVPHSYKKTFPSQLIVLYADFDVMFCCESYNASFTCKGNILIEHLCITENYILPGYAQLKYLDSSLRGRLLDSHEFIEKVHEAVRSSKVAHLPGTPGCGICLTDVRTNIRGPSVKVVVEPNVRKKRFEGDITLCIKCLEWPPSSDWPTRKTRLWPSLEHVRRITSYGFHLVAKPLSNNGDRLPAWRFSFSIAEVELSKLVPDRARKCFLALKVILKDHLQPVVPELTSYHVKTIFLNTLEKKPENFWVDENIEECFQALLKELHVALESKQCQHHWLNGVNLFGYLAETDSKRLAILARKVEKIQEDPAPFIYDDGCCCICSCCTCVRKRQVRRQEVLIDQDAAVYPIVHQQENTNYGTFGKDDSIV